MAIRKVREVFRNGVRYIVLAFDAIVLGERKRKQVKVTTMMEGQELYKQWRNDLIDGKCDCKLFQKMNEYLEYAKQLKTSKAMKKERFHARMFEKFFKNVPLKDFKGYMVDDYVVWRKKFRISGGEVLSDSSVNRDLSTLRYFFNWCIVRGYFIGNNPVFKKHMSEKGSERIVWATPEQKIELFEKANAYQRKILTIALNTGLRQNEIVNLRWDCIDFDNVILRVQSYKPDGYVTKSKRDRTVLIPEDFAGYLRGEHSKAPFNQYVITHEGKPIESIKKSWRNLQKKLSFKAQNGTPFRFHDLRHTYAIDALLAGMSKEMLQAQMGHASITTTEKYARYIGTIPKEILDKMSAAMPKDASRIS